MGGLRAGQRGSWHVPASLVWLWASPLISPNLSFLTDWVEVLTLPLQNDCKGQRRFCVTALHLGSGCTSHTQHLSFISQKLSWIISLMIAFPLFFLFSLPEIPPIQRLEPLDLFSKALDLFISDSLLSGRFGHLFLFISQAGLYFVLLLLSISKSLFLFSTVFTL